MPQQRGVELTNFAIHEDDDQDTQCASDADHYENDSVSEANTTRDEESSVEDEAERSVSSDVQRFQDSFVGIGERYRLISRIGEGTFSTVYKAEDLLYEQYQNEWDSEHSHRPLWHRRNGNHSPRYVAIKKIYVTSSPVRIYNELELLYHLRQAEDVCPLITAFRHQDQVIAVLPYFQHKDFRDYYRDMTVADMRLYFRSLFNGLAFVHKKRIIHRDIKPTNFLYNPVQNRGVLVDFGLAEHAGTDYQPCLCENMQSVRHEIVGHSAHARGLYDKLYEAPAFPKPDRDTRPSKRANRAGTRGFRAPEVLFKCTAQGTGIDIWSAGVMLLTLLARRFPFFNSADDVDALLELTQIFGRERMREAALLHGSVFATSIPSYSEKGHSLERVVMWANPLCKRVEVDRDGRKRVGLGSDEQEAVAFLHLCLDLDPAKRISAREAMKHRFITSAGMGLDSDDTVDLVE